jgi:hypothetical protein
MLAGALEVHPIPVARIRNQVVTDGLDATLVPARSDRDHPRRSLRLLADELVRREVGDPISHATVRRDRTLKKTR